MTAPSPNSRSDSRNLHTVCSGVCLLCFAIIVILRPSSITAQRTHTTSGPNQGGQGGRGGRVFPLLCYTQARLKLTSITIQSLMHECGRVRSCACPLMASCGMCQHNDTEAAAFKISVPCTFPRPCVLVDPALNESVRLQSLADEGSLRIPHDHDDFNRQPIDHFSMKCPALLGISVKLPRVFCCC